MSNTAADEYKYEIISVISENEKSKVYLASSPISTEPIVVKLLKNGDVKLVKKIADINSPFLPKIYHIEETSDSNETAGRTLTVFEEYIGGVTLDKYITDNELTEAQIVELVMQICVGLRTLHTQEPPIIHRDLKPSNILVQVTDGAPLVKIIDFDASREYKPDKPHDTRALGTDTYAPPEQFGYSQTDIRSDIYSLGSVLDEITKDIEISDGLRGVIAKATMFNPDHRYQNIDEFTKAICSYGRKKARRLPILIAAVSVCVLAIVAAFIIFIGNTGDDLAKKNMAGEEIPVQRLDTIDPETGAMVDWVFYYLTETPELSPLSIRPMNAHGEALDIRVSSDVDRYGKEIDTDFWSEDEDGFVTIENEFLSTLDKNIIYTVSVSFTDVMLVFDLMCIDDKSMAKISTPVLNPGYTEFIKKTPENMVFQAENTFGKKLKELKNLDSGEVLTNDDYSYDNKTGRVIINKDYFEKFNDGDYVNLAYIFDDDNDAGQSGEDIPSITICVRDEPYIIPVVKEKSIVIHEADDKDVMVGIEFNSAKGKLEDVFLEDNSKPDDKPITLSRNDYDVTDVGINIKGNYLKTLKKGEYAFDFEFGDVARSIQLTVT